MHASRLAASRVSRRCPGCCDHRDDHRRRRSGSSRAMPRPTRKRSPARPSNRWRGPISAISASAELQFVRHAPYRDLAWSSPSDDPDNAAQRSRQGRVSGARIARFAPIIVRWILTDPAASKYVHPSGIGIAGARIAGELDLSYHDRDAAAHDALLRDPRRHRVLLRAYRQHRSAAQLDRTDQRRSRRWCTATCCCGSVITTTSTSIAPKSTATSIAAAAASSATIRSRWSRRRIKGDALFHEGFETGRPGRFSPGPISGRSLSFNHALFTGKGVNGLNAERATIDGALYWVDITLGPHTMLDLSDARAGALWDDAASWPAAGNLDLTGFVYGDFSGGPADADARLEWLHRQPRSDLGAAPALSATRPWCCAKTAAEEGATQVEIARENAMTQYGGIADVAAHLAADAARRRSATAIVRCAHCGGFCSS